MIGMKKRTAVPSAPKIAMALPRFCVNSEAITLE